MALTQKVFNGGLCTVNFEYFYSYSRLSPFSLVNYPISAFWNLFFKSKFRKRYLEISRKCSGINICSPFKFLHWFSLGFNWFLIFLLCFRVLILLPMLLWQLSWPTTHWSWDSLAWVFKLPLCQSNAMITSTEDFENLIIFYYWRSNCGHCWSFIRIDLSVFIFSPGIHLLAFCSNWENKICTAFYWSYVRQTLHFLWFEGIVILIINLIDFSFGCE